MQDKDIIKILGVNFYNGSVEGVVSLVKAGGLLVVPAAPGLASIKTDLVYYNSLKRADLVIADSGYMALVWNLFHKNKVKRISGLVFLIAFFADKEIQKNEKILLVNPRESEALDNFNYLNSRGFNLKEDMSYIAPMYSKDKVEDEALLMVIEEKKPDFVILNLGGGVQEKLGAWLISKLSYKPGIICTGAAIAFLTGNQANIPNWADALYLGWLFRCIENPRLYIPRYWNSFRLFILLIRYNADAPV